MSDDDLKKYKENLRMVFRLFDSKRKGLIGKEELHSVIRRFIFSFFVKSFSLGKKPTADKIKKIISAASKKTKDAVTIDEFVEYMVNKKKLKSVRIVPFSIYSQKTEEKEKESPSKKKKDTKTAPTKPATPPPKPSTNPPYSFS